MKAQVPVIIKMHCFPKLETCCETYDLGTGRRASGDFGFLCVTASYKKPAQNIARHMPGSGCPSWDHAMFPGTSQARWPPEFPGTSRAPSGSIFPGTLPGRLPASGPRNIAWHMPGSNSPGRERHIFPGAFPGRPPADRSKQTVRMPAAMRSVVENFRAHC